MLLTIACQKKQLTATLVIGPDNNANALVITGYSFNSAVFYLNPINSSGYYDTTLHQTFIVANEDTDSLHLQLIIRFNGEASFIAQDTIPGHYNETDSMMITNKNGQKTTFYSPVYVKNYLYITEYGSVGGYIEGLISGNFVNSFNKLDSLKISNGRFSVLRLPDVY